MKRAQIKKAEKLLRRPNRGNTTPTAVAVQNANPNPGPGEGGLLSMLPQPGDTYPANYRSTDSKFVMPGSKFGWQRGNERVSYKPAPSVNLFESVPNVVERHRSKVEVSRQRASETRDRRSRLGRQSAATAVVQG